MLACAGSVEAQVPTKCLEIERVLVDACNSACPGAQEGENEMFRFIVGPQPIDLNDLSAIWATPNAFLGWVQNATTASLTAQLNATITNCGRLLEPPGGIIPAGKRVLGITSTDLCIPGNSFAGLNDTLYVIYQAPGNTFGHFKNTNNGSGITSYPSGTISFRTFQLTVISAQCTDSVTYDIAQMVNQYGTYGGTSAENDGSSLQVDWPGAPTVTYVNDGCQAPISPFTAQITSEPEELPCGGTTGLVAVATGNIGSVFWTGGTGTFGSPTAYSTTYTLGASETTGTTLSFCAVSACGDTICDTVDLFVEAIAPLTISPSGPTTICAGTTVDLVANGGGTYLWNTGATTAGITVDSAGTYIVGSSNACGAVSDSIAITVENAPVATITGPDAACADAPIQLVVTGSGTYAWNTGATTDTLNTIGPGSYSVLVTGTCGTDQAILVVAEAPTLVPSFSLPISSGCAPFCATLNAADPTLSYIWSFGDGATATGTDATHCFAAGIHDITLTAYPPEGDPRCPGTTTELEVVEAWPTPIADFDISPSVVTLDAPTVDFHDRSIDADQYLWQLGTADPYSTLERSFTYTFSEVACYPVALFVSNQHGCSDESDQEVCVEDPFQLWAPNSFTPNDDGINDRFEVTSTVRDPKYYLMTIYDRWGLALFSTVDLYVGWSGTDIPQGVYVWRIQMRDTNGKLHDRTGHVVLIR